MAYGSNLEEVKALLYETLKNHSLVLQNPAPIIWFKEFNASSIDVIIKFWVNHISMANEVKSDLIISIDKTFRDHNIEIPFPQQDIYIKQINSKESGDKSDI
ncbi:putative MscS family protein.1 precursor [compost metagenome]